MIEIPVNNAPKSDFEKVVSNVLSQLEEDGSAYIDWGANGRYYENCPSKSIADEVAQAFKDKGYYIYIQRMGRGSKSVPEGTAVCYRIHKEARPHNTFDEF